MGRRISRRAAQVTEFHRALAKERGGEGGFVMVFIALTLVIMLIFAAFTIDFGSWYARSSQLKRAADAAALAGVVWMPEFDTAKQYAEVAAARNGFVNNVNNITVDVEQIPNNNRQLRVTITDHKAKQFFSKLITNGQSISRSSVGEYVLPVPLGSPENVFGTGTLSMTNQPTHQNFWAAVNGYCAGHESGDYKLAYNESYKQSNSGCANTPTDQVNSDDYDPDGYLYTIDLPANASSLKLDLYDGGFNRSGSAMDNMLCSSCTETITTVYKIYNRNATPLDTSDVTMNALLASTVTVGTNNASYQNQWKNLYTWNNPVAGRYYVRVLTNPETQNSRGSNGFALRAWTGSSYTTCSTISTASNYSANCPQLHAENAMSIYANISGTTATFYLAQIDPVHAGKTMRINLFDTGEGATNLQIKNPQNQSATFNWSTPCSPQTPPAGGCSGTTSSLDVSGTGAQPYSFVHSTSKYSDRFLTLDIQLPPNYNNPLVYGNKWWKVQYTVTGCDAQHQSQCPTDRTTWSVNIVGDPVHLLQ